MGKVFEDPSTPVGSFHIFPGWVNKNSFSMPVSIWESRAQFSEILEAEKGRPLSPNEVLGEQNSPRDMGSSGAQMKRSMVLQGSED